ncbi:biopolymer transporter ExbD [Marinicella sp. S1101]|uniref:ExbD/TolR family protein n=1 Tax=Marinicella marina TaxID=2996016 RepID=UPI002260EAA0|nr:biopolymer transporter ExbD [Marinicella marina]MCX7554730.1 biopolymer transporter ExbD [Marinicella marina]MDJ1141454.1 biopolymer transporter ExbD [Marinicella marina]
MKFSASETTGNNKLNLTPLIDVVFLLLIFFMVSTTFEKQAKLKIELPEASNQPSVSEQQDLVISISEKGVFFVNNNELVNAQSQSLKNALQNIVADVRDMPVIIRADANVAHKHVVMAMDVLGTMGFSKVSMATTQPKSNP